MEVARRRGDYAMMGVAAVVTLGVGDSCTHARLAYCNAGETPVSAPAAAPAGAANRGEQGEGRRMTAELHSITTTVNGTPYSRRVESRLLLSDFIRHELGLTGTRVGCEHGVCGACTILYDGLPARSCLMFAAPANGHEITTVEGLGP